MNLMQLCGVLPRPMYAYCLPCAWLGLSHTSKLNVLSLILLIPLVEHTNQKRGIVDTALLKVGLGLDLIEIDLRKAILEKYNFFIN